MKKFIICLLAIIVIFPLYATTYTLDTKYGPKTLEIPEGYTEIEVLKTIATEYYNLDGDYKALEKETKKLISESENYIKTIDSYKTDTKKLLDSYHDLKELYNKQRALSVVRATIGGSVTFKDQKFNSAGVSVGALLGNSVIFSIGVNWPLSTTYGVSFIF